MSGFYTTREVGVLLRRPEWAVRRACDDLATPVPRFGGKRAIPAERLAEVAEQIRLREQKVEQVEIAGT